MSFKQPSYFLAHGSPHWIVQPEANGPRFLTALGRKILASPNRPKCVVMISAHWEADLPNQILVTNVTKHNLLFDYYNFPKHYYDVKYSAKGDPIVANRAMELLSAAGFDAETSDRGLDHGAFTPLMYLFPNAEIPIVAISLPVAGDPRDYVRLGKALEPLRDEGVALMTGGFIVHNLRMFFSKYSSNSEDAPVAGWAKEFVGDVESAALAIEDRDEKLLATFKHKHYLTASPTPEHYAPVVVAAAAGGTDAAEKVLTGWSMGFWTDDSYRFGMEY